MKNRPQAPAWTQFFLYGFILCCYFPLFYLIRSSFYNNGEFSLYWYEQLLADRLLIEPALRSLQISLLSAFLSVVIGVMAAVSLHKKISKSAHVLNFFIGISLALPELVMALSLMAWFFLLGLKLSLLTVTISHITFSIAFVVFIVSARLSRLNPQTEEAAKDLGAGSIEVFTKVTLPQLKPALILAFFLCFLLSFDDFLITFYVNGVGTDTLPIRLYQTLKQGTSPKLSALASLLLLLPISLSAVAIGLRKITKFDKN